MKNLLMKKILKNLLIFMDKELILDLVVVIQSEKNYLNKISFIPSMGSGFEKDIFSIKIADFMKLIIL